MKHSLLARRAICGPSIIIASYIAGNAALADDAAGLLPEVVVSVTRSDTTLTEMPLHTSIVDRADLEAAPATALDQVLRNVQGFNFTGVPASQSDPTGHQTRMRGVGNAKVLVLRDGVPIHDPFYLTTQWYKVPLDSIERVEVVRGGNSSLWGNMAVAGVVNVISRRSRAAGAELAASAGSYGSKSLGLRGTLPLGERWGVALAADRAVLNGYQVTPDEYLWRFPEKAPTDAVDSNAEVTLDYNDAAGLAGFLRLGYHLQDQDISYRDGANVQRSPDIAAGLGKAWDSGLKLQANAWAQAVQFEKYNGATCYFQPSGTRCPSTTAVTTAQVNANVLQYYTQYGSLRYRERGASASLSRPGGGWWGEWSLGFDYRRLAATDRETFYSAPSSLTAPQANLAALTFGGGTQEFTGGFVQAHLRPFESLEATLASRYDSWRNTDRVATRTTAAGATSGGPSADASRSAFNPSLALRYEATDALQLRGAYYRSFRAPGFNNTLRTFGATTPTIANPDLGPENMRGWEGGFDWKVGGVALSATYFRYDIEHQIATFRVNSYATAPALVRTICSNGGANLTNCGGSANFYTNDQDGQSHGVELGIDWPVTPSWRVVAEYTRTSATLTRRGAVVTDPLNTQLVGLPWNVGVLRSSWRAGGKLRLNAELRYIGRMPIDTTSTAGTVYEQGAITVLNGSAGYALTPRIDISLGLVNLLDREYSENGYSFSQPFNRTLSTPRSFNLGLHMRFQD